MLLVVVDDLIFLSKIQQVADVSKIPVALATPADVVERIGAGPPTAILIDLNRRSGLAVELIRNIKSAPRLRHIPIVGYISHVQVELAAAARAAGCDMVLARSALAKQLPQLLLGLSRGELRVAPSVA